MLNKAEHGWVDTGSRLINYTIEARASFQWKYVVSDRIVENVSTRAGNSQLSQSFMKGERLE